MIYQHRLTNGMRVVLEDIPFVRSVSMGIWVATGSRDEPSDQGGISHFLEHMFFKGTSKLSARQLAEVFDGIGGQVNAFTTKEYTCFHAKVLDQHAELALRTLADMMLDSRFDELELDLERRVIIEEINMYEDNPEEAVHDLIIESAFAGHPLGTSILGTKESLNQLGRDQLLTYVEDRYTPDNMVLSISGHIEPEPILHLLEALFGGIHRTTKVYNQGGPQFNHAQVWKKRPIEQLHTCLATPAYAYADPMMYGLMLFNNILGASSSSRLFQEIREERGLAYSVFSYYNAFHDAGLFLIYFGSSPAQADEVSDCITRIVSNVVQQGVTQDELRTAKNQVVGSMTLGLESTSNRMSRLGKNELLLGYQVSFDTMIEQVESVTLDTIHHIAQHLFSDPFSYVAMGPQEYRFRTPEVAG